MAAISLQLGYPTLASIPHSIVNGYKNVLAVAVATEYSFPLADKVKEYLKDPSAFAAATQAAAPAAAEGAAGGGGAPAAAKKEEPEEEEEASDEDMGEWLCMALLVWHTVCMLVLWRVLALIEVLGSSFVVPWQDLPCPSCARASWASQCSIRH